MSKTCLWHGQLDLFDERNLISLTSTDYPGEQLVACRNPEFAKRRAAKRQELISATVRELEKVKASVGHGRLRSAAKIGERIGRMIGKYKVGPDYPDGSAPNRVARYREAIRPSNTPTPRLLGSAKAASALDPTLMIGFLT